MSDNIEFIGDLRRALEARAQSDARHVEGPLRPARVSPPVRILVGVGAILLAALVVLLTLHPSLWGARAIVQATPGSIATGGRALGAVSNGPFPSGKEVSLAEAQRRAPFPIHRPSSPLASDSSITAVWIQDVMGDDGARDFQAAVDYVSGLEILLGPVTFDPATYYANAARELGNSSRVQNIDGHPALVIPEGNDGGDGPGSVAFVIDGTEITVYGHSPIGDLIAVATSVR